VQYEDDDDDLIANDAYDDDDETATCSLADRPLVPAEEVARRIKALDNIVTNVRSIAQARPQRAAPRRLIPSAPRPSPSLSFPLPSSPFLSLPFPPSPSLSFPTDFLTIFNVYVFMFVFVCFIFVCSYGCMYVMYLCICAFACQYVCVCVCVYLRACVCVNSQKGGALRAHANSKKLKRNMSSMSASSSIGSLASDDPEMMREDSTNHRDRWAGRTHTHARTHARTHTHTQAVGYRAVPLCFATRANPGTKQLLRYSVLTSLNQVRFCVTGVLDRVEGAGEWSDGGGGGGGDKEGAARGQDGDAQGQALRGGSLRTKGHTRLQVRCSRFRVWHEEKPLCSKFLCITPSRRHIVHFCMSGTQGLCHVDPQFRGCFAVPEAGDSRKQD
jgi:hypothetical protein